MKMDVADNRSRAFDNRNIPKSGLDYFPTPPGATRMFMEQLKKDVCLVEFSTGKPKNVPYPFFLKHCIEPAAGGGHMAEVLKGYFRNVWSFDIKDYGYPLDHSPIDFCSPLERRGAIRSINIPEKDFEDAWLITNPPFNRAEEFITGAWDLGIKNIAIMARLQFIEGGRRYDNLFSKKPPTFVYSYSRRVQFSPGALDEKSGGKLAFAWFVWADGLEGTRLDWLPGKVEDFSQKTAEEM